MKIQYIEKRLTSAKMARLDEINDIIEDYRAQGYVLTLRQLYYALVSRAVIENSDRSYKNLGNLLNDGRLLGIVDWSAIEDRGRNVEKPGTWSSPSAYIMPDQFTMDKWQHQPYHVEVWIEKDALSGIIDPPCTELEVPYLACKGYMSQSEQWEAGRRFRRIIQEGRQPVVIHLGDHDPSGIHMTRDNERRLCMFAEGEVIINRIALNMDQVEEYGPPPNPLKIKDGKLSDSRAQSYVDEFGIRESWELDALEPRVMDQMVRDAILEYRDKDVWDDSLVAQDEGIERLREVRDELEEEGL